ncbi:mas-related G-protein coupled receptor member B8-like [Mus pahari]|uniref:mas-related G-protein coupled receptor member B8-like n=1 Tax=Mus pahari TaxID=10093 RepID=UPI000A306C15|nr:mas-related G-protein coupled receptor member B8-like [Mus pahari]
MDSSFPDWDVEFREWNESYFMESSSCDNMSLAMSLLSIIIAFIGLAGNAIVLWLLGFHIHRNAFSVYILNLAGANFLFLCPYIVFYLVKISVHYYSINIHIILLLNTVSTLAHLAGVSMITAISAEYWLAVILPNWFHGGRPKHTSAVICTLLWALSLLLSLWDGIICGVLDHIYNWDMCWKFDLIILVWLLVLFVVLARSNQALLFRIFCGSQQTPVTRLYVTILLTALVFLICGFPFEIGSYLLYWKTEIYLIMPCNTFHETILLLSCVNSCANPIICLLVGSIKHCQFQCGGLRLLLQRAIQDTPEEEGEEVEEVVEQESEEDEESTTL